MKSNTLAILILAYCILVACTRTSPNAQLVQADSLMQKFPDSALRFLQKIRPEELNSLEDRAYHALLLTEVKDKNFIQQTEDSQIRIAVQYYDSIKDIPMQAKSYYYLGCIWRDKDKHPEALKEFFKAITYSKKANDNKLANEPNMASGNNGIIPKIVVSEAIITGRRRLCELSINAVTGSTP